MSTAPLAATKHQAWRVAYSLRMTPRVRRVLALLEGREIPVTAQQLYAELRDAGDHTGRTTVYRALHALADAGLVHEFRGTDEIGYRACTPAPHDHLVCAGCGRVQERHLTGLDESLADLKREGFLVASCRIEVYGLCPRCTRRQSTVAPRAL